MNEAQINEIWLVKFPFSDLTASKLRPALIIANHRQEIILIGIFSKIPIDNIKPFWVLLSATDSNFPQTGLKKSSLIRADKIATVSQIVLNRKLGTLPLSYIPFVQNALKNALNLTN
ncbi:MAG: type II toxin-antitoxin system PemK/MazF family toxin [Microcystaceae cyanobacterium]